VAAVFGVICNFYIL